MDHFTKKLVESPSGRRGHHTLQLSYSENMHSKKGPAIQLAGVGRKYYLHHEDEDELYR